jgi:outer membrane protein OmpA-like peptidoglycan-associated protein
MAGACAQRELDKKPELAQQHGYYVSEKDAVERGGVGGYVDVPSNTERANLNETQNQAGIAPAQQPVAQAPVAPAPKTITVLSSSPKTILFDVGDSTIKDESMPVLDEIATQMKQAPDQKVKVEGFADKTGNHEDNMALSSDRATSVKDYLEEQGAPSQNLTIASHGDEQATTPNASPEDRKVTISLIKVS